MSLTKGNASLIVFLLFVGGLLQAQILQPITWKFSKKQINDSTYQLKFIANTDKDWHLYSQFTPDGGPLPTEFEFKKNKDVKFIGKVKEPQYTKKFEDVFGVDVYFFETQLIEFTQEVSIKSNQTEIKGSINGMTCKDDVGCIPFDEVSFSFDLKRTIAESYKKTAIDSDTVAVANAPIVAPKSTSDCKDLIIDGLVMEESNTEKESYWIIFLLGFGGGLIALLTPCVFPMIPLTVSFFTKTSGSRRKSIGMAALYGVFITAIYVLLAVPFLVAKIPPDTLNEIATSATLNIIFFVIFVAFAFSFFGYYEITMPSKLTNKMDSASDIGGIIGIFFMAVTLALVSFSCTGPILGSFLAGTLATNPDPYNLLFVMLGFGLALGLPFSLFAAFPSMMKSLPKSGGWLNSVKVILGFLEIGMALKFLSNADLVEQWGILKRETFLVIWAIIGLAMAAYLMGWIRFPHDSPLKKRSPFRIGLAAFFALTGIYFASGLFGNSLGLISGFPPPVFYSYSNKNSDETKHEIKGLVAENDFYLAQQKAQALNKPLLIDFTGWACVNCRRMEENVWIDPEVNEYMKNEFVLVSLYVDEKMNLPENEQFISCKTGKNVKTVGNKWSNFQVVNFNSNSQPQYVILSPQGKLLNSPIGYSSKEEYLAFLKQGKQNVSYR